jgi:hypothetical protein
VAVGRPVRTSHNRAVPSPLAVTGITLYLSPRACVINAIGTAAHMLAHERRVDKFQRPLGLAGRSVRVAKAQAAEALGSPEPTLSVEVGERPLLACTSRW